MDLHQPQLIQQLRAFDGRVRRIMRRTPLVMRNHRLSPLFKEWRLTAAPDGLVILFGVLDDDRIIERTQTPLEKYLDQSVLHDLSTNAGDGQYPVVRCNHTGAGYAFVLKAARAPKLPATVDYPGHQRDKLAWGVTFDDKPVATGWGAHMMIAGMTGSGKSTMLRGIVAQGLLESFQIALCDVGARTFPMLEDHPALITPLAIAPNTVARFVDAILDEIERRDGLYRAVSGYPDELNEYNALATTQSKEPLKRLLVVFDEYTDLVIATGGVKKEFSQLATRLALGARKWGITLVFAGHQFQRESSGLIRDQCSVRVCFKVEDHTTASIVVGSPLPTQFVTPGRGVMRGQGKFQAYRFDKELLIDLARRKAAVLLTDAEIRLVQQIGRDQLFNWENVSRATGLKERAARRLVEEWDARGLAAISQRPGGGRYLADAALKAAGIPD
jgi:hypothetical protein